MEKEQLLKTNFYTIEEWDLTPEGVKNNAYRNLDNLSKKYRHILNDIKPIIKLLES